MNARPPRRVGIVGCGFFAPNHAQAWAHLPGATIAALCDRETERARRLAASLGLAVPIFADAGEMVARGGIDFLDIITTPPSHAALVGLAAAARLPAIVQKPMAMTYAEAEAMTRGMAETGVPFMVHENFRFQAPIMAVAEAIRAGGIGAPVYAHIAFRTAYDVFAGQPYLAREKRLALADVGVHVLDVARFLLGEVSALSCMIRQVRPGIAGEDMATVLARHESGAISVVECSYASKLPEETFPQTLITVEAAEGSVRLGPDYALAVRGPAGVRHANVAPARLPWATPPWDVVQHSVWETQRHWLDCLESGTEPATSGRDNLRTLALVEAAYAAADTGQRVAPAAAPAF